MNANEIIIRDATLEDAKELVEIYRYYVEETAISFEYENPSVEEFQNRMKNFQKKYPYLVAVLDGKIIGYAYGHAYIDRRAYDHCAEITIYLDKDSRKTGCGRKIYEALEARLKDMGIINLYSCIATTDVDDPYLTNNSKEFHEHMGYNTIGVFKNSGYKFDRWYDMIWMEKIIGEYK